MGQKVNPVGLRIGVNKNWNSRWYANDNEFHVFLNEDIKVRNYLEKKLKEALLSHVEIERIKTDKGYNVIIMVFVARPGVVIGQDGKNINELKDELAKLLNNSEVRIDVVEVKNPDLDANIVAQEIAKQLEERASFRTAQKKAIQRVRKAGGGKKPWRQKGTGRARAGSSRSPVWVGGGTVFGPIGNQNYKISQNKKEHKLALKSALSLKTKDGLLVIDEIKFDEKKTKNFVAFLDALKVGGKALVVVDEITENIFASARNVGYAKVVTTDNVSVLDLLNVDNLVISQASAKALEEALK